MNMLLNLLVAVALQATPAQPVTYDDALALKKITATAYANGGSTHYQQPVVVELKNITAENLEVTLPVGRYFKSEDTTDQNFVSTEPLLFTLAPGQVQKLPVSAMCVNHHKGAPGTGMAYAIKKPATEKLAKTADYIYRRRLSGSYLGQTVMWCVSDGEPLEDVFGYERTEVDDALKFLSALTGKAIPKPPAADDYIHNPRAAPKIRVGGNFEFRFSQPKAVHIAMFDGQNIAVRELYNNPNEPAGEHKVSFEFDGSVYNQGTYYIRFLADNRILMQQKMTF